MEILELNNNTYEVDITPEGATLDVFKTLIKKDKSKNKDTFKKEIAFIYFFTNVKSSYLDIEDEEERTKEIIKDIGLNKNWIIDKNIKNAINYCNSKKTINEIVYESARISALAVSEYLRTTKDLLISGDVDIAKITSALDKIPNIMSKLNEANKQLVEERKNLDKRKKGTKDLNMFEDGI